MPTPLLAETNPQRAHPWLEALPDAAILMAESGTIVAVNAIWRVFAEANAGAPDAYLGENYPAVCRNAPVAEVGDLPRLLEQVLTGASASLEWEYPCHSPGERRWFRLIATCFQEHGRPYVLMIHCDITDKRLHQEAAKAREQQLESVLTHTREGFVVVHGEGRGTIRYANTRAGELLGDAPEQLIGQNLRIPAPSVTGQILNIQLSAQERRSMEIYGVQAEWKGEPAWLLHIHDITERKALETRLADWGAAVEATSEAVIVSDAAERITAVNSAFTTITGYSEKEVQGHAHGLLQSGSHDRATYQGLSVRLKKKGHWQGETWGRRKGGEVFPTWQTINAITDEAGEVTRYVSTLTDLSRIKQAEQRLEHLAYHDPLTGLPNRRLFGDRLEQALAQSRRSGKTFAVLLLGLNDFKALNYGFGHEIGDQALKAVGPRVQEVLKEGDTVARWCGDELVLLIRDLETSSAISALIERTLEALEAPLLIASQEFRLTATIGVAIGGTWGQSAASLIMQADSAMYSAKLAGQRYAFFASQVSQAARERMYLGTELARALEREQLTIHYQPQVDLRSGQCFGLEALIRWHHPVEGWISPARFIPVAEQGGLIHKLGKWALEKACLQASQWLAGGWDFGQLAINVAPQQLSRNDLADQVARTLSQTGLAPSRLELELTESSLVEPSDAVLKILEALRNKGIRIAIDDFGTGYSSLGYLKELPVDRLKIDRSFVNGLPEDEKARAVMQAVVALGDRLGFDVLAEGIETPAQRQALLQEGCVAGQGYLFATPSDAESIRELRFPLSGPYEARERCYGQTQPLLTEAT